MVTAEIQWTKQKAAKNKNTCFIPKEHLYLIRNNTNKYKGMSYNSININLKVLKITAQKTDNTIHKIKLPQTDGKQNNSILPGCNISNAPFTLSLKNLVRHFTRVSKTSELSSTQSSFTTIWFTPVQQSIDYPNIH